MRERTSAADTRFDVFTFNKLQGATPRQVVTRTSRPAFIALRAIVADLRDEPLEDGVTHRAESSLQTLLDDGLTLRDFEEFGSEGRSGHAADLFKLLGRCRPADPRFRRGILERAFASPNIDVRDAAVGAAEAWDDADAMAVLRAHREPTRWLAAYIEKLIQQHSST